MALPLCQAARRRYRLGALVAGDLAQCRRACLELARAGPQPGRAAEAATTAGALHASAALHELLLTEIRRLEPLVGAALARVEAVLGAGPLDELLEAFAAEFELEGAIGSPSGTASPVGPATSEELRGAGAQRETTAAAARSRPVPARLERTQRLLAVWLLNRNPALAGLRELFDDRGLEHRAGSSAAYRALTETLLGLVDEEARARSREQRAPEPPSERLLRPFALPALDDQLRFIAGRWPELPPGARELALRAVDALAEERPRSPGPGPVEMPVWSPHGGPPEPPLAAAGRSDDGPAGPAPGELRVPAAPVTISTPGVAAPGAAEPRRAAAAPVEPAPVEPAWMTELVLVAKHTRVWLDQLSREHSAPIERLDQIPEAALARLAADGFTGLWLVGVWERSAASAAIKRRAGGLGGASAYSIFEYRVAAGLGGDDAAERLQERALRHGIRLAVDVVPNHVGIDSRWVREHPEWLMQTGEPPFPGYRFTGPDLSGDPDLGIYLEDGYADRSDAAVVFALDDRRSGLRRYVYHGNDGTSTPWNDTAQLDYTKPGVRAAMRELILGLARRFPVLRFDAAMTLTRKHFQRLWFPGPGDGGAVPSRSEHGMSRAQFERLVPEELWREVALDVAREAPGTLLLAEAFWLMESTFVRELGMHRVYQSAFMHSMREHATDRLADLLEQAHAHDPGILARYANFLTTPDEDPAAKQLGRGDRYFGACAVLATLPGLPLFGHGQVEGFGEKYGMEFERALEDERPDPALVERHRREIMPLLRQRARLGAPASFLLLELANEAGAVCRDVLAYCSGAGAGAVVVAFNDSPWRRRGRLRPRGAGESGAQRDGLAARLAIEAGGRVAFRELRAAGTETALEAELSSRGLAVALAPWQAIAWSGFGPVAPLRRPVAPL